MGADFDELIDRRGTNSLKWDVAEHELPLSIADMDFATAPQVTEAIMAKVATGVFGYQIVPEEYAKAVVEWWRLRHGVTFQPEWVTLTTGTVPAVSSMVRTLTDPTDSVVVLTPVYNVFFASIRNSGRTVSASRLIETGTGFEIDWEDFETRLTDPHTSLLIFCNPHNPTGTIWTPDELGRVGELCAKHGVRVISDEVHCDLTAPGYDYAPFASVSEECARVSVTCLSASKGFNLAGLQSAAVVVPDNATREIVVKGFNRDEVAEPNVIAAEATIAAFKHGGPWLDSLRVYLHANKEHAAAVINTIPGLRTSVSAATYLLWIDAGGLTDDSAVLAAFIRERTGLVLSAGNAFDPAGSSYLRMNVACPRTRLDDALLRLRQAVAEFRAQP